MRTACAAGRSARQGVRPIDSAGWEASSTRRAGRARRAAVRCRLARACAAGVAAALVALAARAQSGPSAEPPAPAPATPPAAPGPAAPAGTTPATEQLAPVNITGSRPDDVQERRQSTAAKIVIGREEIDRFGDSTLGDVLKRLPGVTIQGRPGRGGAIRLRGLGSGYTQILLDGERVPPGFSLDSLTPDQIERIEILRAPTAETGARAIAGTINIITREGYSKRVNDLRLNAAYENGKRQPVGLVDAQPRRRRLDHQPLGLGLLLPARQRQHDAPPSTPSTTAPSPWRRARCCASRCTARASTPPAGCSGAARAASTS